MDSKTNVKKKNDMVFEMLFIIRLCEQEKISEIENLQDGIFIQRKLIFRPINITCIYFPKGFIFQYLIPIECDTRITTNILHTLSLTHSHSLTHTHSHSLTHTHSLTLTHTHSLTLTLTICHVIYCRDGGVALIVEVVGSNER